MKTVIGVFMSPTEAQKAIDDMEDAGFDRDEVSLLAQKESVEGILDAEKEEAAVESAGVGAVGGTALGGLIGLAAGATALVVPGVGPALAAGAWAATLGTTAAGAGVGAAYGGLVGALIGFGVTEEETHLYVNSVQEGGILLLVQPDDPEQIATGRRIMDQHDGIGVDVVTKPEKD